MAQHNGKTVVEFVVGGSFPGYGVGSQATVVVMIDARNELARVPDMPHLVKVPVGDGETVLTLLERVAAVDPAVVPLLEEYRRRPSVHLASGMAQDPRLGACAVADLAHQGHLAGVFEDVFIKLLVAANGQLHLVVVRELASSAGGMGAGGASIAGARFAAYALERTHAIVLLHKVRLGALTYAPVAPRGIANAHATVSADVDDLDSQLASRRLRRMEFLEAPLRSESGTPLGGDRDLRAALAGTALQARFSQNVADRVETIECNHTTISKYGEMLRVQPAWSRVIPSERIVRSAARQYAHELGRLRDQPDAADLSVGTHVDATLEIASVALPSTESVMAAVRAGDVRHSPLMDRLLNAELSTYRCTVRLHTTSAGALEVPDIIGNAGRPDTLAEFRGVCQRYRGIIGHLETALRAAVDEGAAAQADLERRRRELQAERRRLRSLRSVWVTVVHSRKRLHRRTEIIVAAIGAAHSRASEARARVGGFEGALARIREDLARYERDWLGRVIAALDRAGNGARSFDAIDWKDLASVYPDLLGAMLRLTDLSTDQDEAGLRELEAVLVKAVAHVTLEGVAKMLDVDAEPGAIVAAVTSDSWAYKAPLWGGETTYLRPRHHFVVFPPLSAEALGSLKRVTDTAFPELKLATADSVAAGLAVIAMDFYPVTSRGDVLPPLYSAVSPGAPTPQEFRTLVETACAGNGMAVVAGGAR